MRRPSTLVAALVLAALTVSTMSAWSPADAIDSAPYILGGTDVTPADDTPWLAAVLIGDEPDTFLAQFCTGTLISPSHVLTAGHCVTDPDGSPAFAGYEVSVGILNLVDITPAERYEAVATAHPDWTGSDGVDLAILTLSTPIVDKEPMAIRSVAPGIGDLVSAYGWGAIDPDELFFPTVAQKGTMTVTTDYGSTTGCGFGSGAVDHSHQFCFGDPAQAMCAGDSGGPIVIFDSGEPYLVGAMSSGSVPCNVNATDEIAERIVDSLPWICDIALGSRNSPLELTTTAIGLKDGQITMSTATVTNSGPCPSTNIVITGLSLPCVAAPTVSVTAGTVTNSTWTIASLAAGATATATISGTVTGGACSSTLALTATPVTAGPVNASFGGTAVACPTASAPFVDVSATSFALADIACIFGLAITTGTSATTYSPFDNVTREQMAAFLARLWRSLDMTCPTGPIPFTDVSASSFALADIACIFGLAITTGTSATSYSPGDFVTREQMAAFLARLWRALGETCPSTGTPFIDVPAPSFAVADIACIFGLAITTGTSATTYSPFNFVTREQMAAFLARLWRIA